MGAWTSVHWVKTIGNQSSSISKARPLSTSSCTCPRDASTKHSGARSLRPAIFTPIASSLRRPGRTAASTSSRTSATDCCRNSATCPSRGRVFGSTRLRRATRAASMRPDSPGVSIHMASRTRSGSVSFSSASFSAGPILSEPGPPARRRAARPVASSIGFPLSVHHRTVFAPPSVKASAAQIQRPSFEARGPRTPPSWTASRSTLSSRLARPARSPGRRWSTVVPSPVRQAGPNAITRAAATSRRPARGRGEISDPMRVFPGRRSETVRRFERMMGTSICEEGDPGANTHVEST